MVHTKMLKMELVTRWRNLEEGWTYKEQLIPVMRKMDEDA
jgi:hypothetical protein